MNLIESIQEHCFNQGLGYIPEENQFRISSVGYCPRKLQYKRILPDLEAPHDLTTLGTFAVGNALHEWIQTKLPESVLVKAEQRITYKHGAIELVGHVDLLLQTETGLKVSDIKSANNRSFGYKRKDASDEHIFQANTYARIMGVREFSILYVNKDTFEMIEHNYDTSEDKFQFILNKCQTIYDFTAEGRLLDKAPIWNGKECEWKTGQCPYKDICDNFETFDDLIDLMGDKSGNTE